MVRSAACAASRQEARLVRVLDLAQFAQHRACGFEAAARQDGLEQQDVHGPETIRQADGAARRVGGGPGAEQLRHDPGRVVGLAEGDHSRRARRRERSGAGLHGFQPRNHERNRALARHHEQRDALHGLAHEPREVAQVRPHADQQRRESTLGDGVAARGEPRVRVRGCADVAHEGRCSVVRDARQNSAALLPASASTSGAIVSIDRLGNV